jgi:hypothetical protein
MTDATTDVKNAKRSAALSVLDDLADELDKGFLEGTFPIRGIQWTMRLLQDHERNWANGYLKATSLQSMVTSVRAPTLAIGIRKINGLDVEAFFIQTWEEQAKVLSAVEKQILAATNPYVKQYYFAEQLFAWLSIRPPTFVQELWDKWMELENRRDEAEKAMGKSLVPDGISETPPTT